MKSVGINALQTCNVIASWLQVGCKFRDRNLTAKVFIGIKFCIIYDNLMQEKPINIRAVKT
jgi:hypothetical protein